MITSPTARTQYTVTTAPQTFVVPFYFLAASDLAVVKTVADIDTPLVLNSDYTVAGAGTNPSTATVILSASIIGATLTIYRNAPITQPTSYTPNDRFPSTTAEQNADRLAMQVQQLGLKVDRALRLPVTNTAQSELALNARKNKRVGFDNNGDIAFEDPIAVTVATGSVIEVSNYSAARAIVGTGLTVGRQVEVSGYAASADGGYGLFTFTNVNPGSDNNGTILACTGGWLIRNFSNPVFPKWFGAKADDTTPDTTALQAAINWANGYESGVVELDPGDSYRSAALTINTNRVRFRGNGAKISFPTVTSGVAFTPTNDDADPNLRPSLNLAHPIENIVFVGPNSGTSVCVDLNDTSLSTIAGVTFRGCGFQDWYRHAKFREGAFLSAFDSCHFFHSAAFAGACFLEIPTATNAGERNSFTNCSFINGTQVLIHGNGNATTVFSNCSFDYCTRFMTQTAGAVLFNGCHMENSGDLDYWFHISSSPNALASFDNCDLIIQSARATYNVFYCDTAVVNGGIVWNGGRIGDSNHVPATGKPLVGGTGRTVFRNISTFSTANKTSIGIGSSILAYGDFESANYTADWTRGGDTLPVRSSTTSHGGTYSLKFAALSTDAVVPNAYASIPCLPGQNFLGELWYKTVGVAGSSGTFFVQAEFLDGAGNSLLSSGLTVTTDVGTWTRRCFSIPDPAPKGTRTVRLFISLFGTLSGTPVAYVDDVIVSLV